jgi:hypothetical protein
MTTSLSNVFLSSWMIQTKEKGGRNVIIMLKVILCNVKETFIKQIFATSKLIKSHLISSLPPQTQTGV